jgi:uncharacterized membrane protein YesL
MEFKILLSSALIVAGAVFIIAAILSKLKIKESVPEEVKQKWTVSTIFMVFFLIGYLAAVAILVLKVAIPIEIITGAIFFGGGLFVFLIINLFKTTLNTIEEQEADLWLSKEKLRRKMEEK